ncbi:uncharacterized protein Dere_GG16029, isoform C [Drosophila erecta]|uniref:Uncharacterized protein, isoform C n=1 Tax=Drosophila erecta TaxID=7220 RepID=B3NIC1_DROER|nr:uncharacterized protein Dere_GG16029, isoform C [Drosophila erecta]
MSQMQLQSQRVRRARHHRRHQSAEPCECLRPVIRVFGLLTSFAVLVMLIEIKWLVTIFLQLQCAEDNYQRRSCSCSSCWRLSAICGGWRPTPVYAAIGICLILYPHNLWLSYVAGMFLILLGLLRLCTLLRFSPSKEEGLLPQCDFEKVSSFVDTMEDDFAEVSASQAALEDEAEEEGDDQPAIDDDVC